MKTEVDLVQLAQAVSAAILQFAQPQPTITQREINDLVEEEKPKMIKEYKKRGRPKKSKPEVTVTSEEEDVYISPSPTHNNYMAPAKVSNFTIQHDPDKKVAKRVAFKKKKRINQFNDDLTLATAAMFNEKGEKIKYPQHTEGRGIQKEHKYKCDVCNNFFMAFPSYIPPKGEGGHQPQIRCYSCNSK